MSNGYIQILCFRRYYQLLAVRHRTEGTHIVQTVGEFDDDNAHVLCHRHENFAEVFRLFLFLRTEHDFIELVPFVKKKIPLLIEKYGYLPKMFNPYNLAEIKDIAPCLTTQNSQTMSNTLRL